MDITNLILIFIIIGGIVIYVIDTYDVIVSSHQSIQDYLVAKRLAKHVSRYKCIKYIADSNVFIYKNYTFRFIIDKNKEPGAIVPLEYRRNTNNEWKLCVLDKRSLNKIYVELLKVSLKFIIDEMNGYKDVS